MKPNQRWLIIGGVLLATLAAGYFVDDEPVPEKSKRKTAAVAKNQTADSAGDNRRAGSKDKVGELAAAPLVFPEPAAVEEVADEESAARIDPFRSKSWFVAPPPPPPPKPVAPPLPFQFLGKVIEDGEIRVFLHHQGKHIVAKLGDVINGIYSVEEIGGGRMTFLYQPLKEKQILSIGPDN